METTKLTTRRVDHSRRCSFRRFFQNKKSSSSEGNEDTILASGGSHENSKELLPLDMIQNKQRVPTAASYDTQQWLLSKGMESPSIFHFFQAFVEILKGHLSLDRLVIAPLANHAQAMIYIFTYLVSEDGNAVLDTKEIAKDQYEAAAASAGEDSPFEVLKNDPSIGTVRNKATDKHIPKSVASYFEKGFTELYAKTGLYDQKMNFAISYGTRQKGGFSKKQADYLEDIHLALNSTMSFLIQRAISHSLLTSYLGDDAGTRAFRGNVTRGDLMKLRSVLWFSDIRNYTALSTTTKQSQVVSIINTILEVTESVLKEFGGEILKIMGDGIMAAFVEPDLQEKKDMFYGDTSVLESIRDDRSGEHSFHSEPSKVKRRNQVLCQNARRAAAKLQTRLAELRRESPFGDLELPEVGVGLHYGSCGYGNIGGSKRLDFTVIGNSVNLASRIEGQCSSFGAKVLASDAFVKRDCNPVAWKKVGSRKLKGIEEEVDLYEIQQQNLENQKSLLGFVVEGFSSDDDDEVNGEDDSTASGVAEPDEKDSPQRGGKANAVQ